MEDQDCSNVHSKGLVQVHVADVTAADRRVCQTNLGVEVRAVQIDLSAIFVNDLTRVLHTVLENSEGRRVRNL